MRAIDVIYFRANSLFLHSSLSAFPKCSSILEFCTAILIRKSLTTCVIPPASLMCHCCHKSHISLHLFHLISFLSTIGEISSEPPKEGS